MDKENVKLIVQQYWKWICVGLLGVFILLFVLREYLAEMLLLIFLLICLGYVLFKAVYYIVKYGFKSFRLVLKIFAFVIALGVIVTILSRL